MSDNQKQEPAADLNQVIESAIEAKLSGITAKLGEFADGLQKQEQARQAQERTNKILSLCKEAGLSELSQEMIADESLSVADVREKLWSKMIKDRNLPEDSLSQQPGGNQKVVDPDKEQDDELSATWEDGKDIYQMLGLSQEDLKEVNGMDSENPEVVISLSHKPYGYGQSYGSLV